MLSSLSLTEPATVQGESLSCPSTTPLLTGHRLKLGRIGLRGSAKKQAPLYLWSPQPGPQTDAIAADWCPELFYGGAAGGGKSDFLLGDFVQDVPKYGGAWVGILFRRTYNELEELMRRAHELYPQTGGVWHEQPKTWTWPNKAQLKMRYLEREADATRYLGHSYTWIGWDELTQWPGDYGYKYLRGRLRSAAQVPTKRIRAAANPGGVGHHWVKSYFVSPYPTGYKPIDDAVTGMQRIFIPAKLTDNQILLSSDPGYAGRLRGLASDAMVRAWLDGDWTVIEGAFFDCWSLERHVVSPFTLPADWTRFRSMDWGSAKPFSVGWWAIASETIYVGRKRVPRGALVRFSEWYGSKRTAEGMGTNVGLKLDAETAAAGIVEREQRLQAKWPGQRLRTAVADPSIFKEDGGPSIGERINTVLTRSKIVPFRKADNTRVPQRGALSGWDQVRARLVGDGEDPMIFFFSTCVDSIRTLPNLQHDPDRPEDVQTDSEDHAPDEIRYACNSRPISRTIPVVKIEPTVGYTTYRDPRPNDWRIA